MGMKISTRVPLDQLRPPENDVREHRPEQQVQSLAKSMGDPQVGQLQPVLAYPAGYEELELETQDDLQDLVRDGHDIIVLDGETRRQAAADILGWHDLWTWIWSEPPTNATVAQLDANTERIDMTEYETVRAIVTHKEETGRTWAEVAEDVGYHPDTLSQYAQVVNGPNWLTDPLQDPQHHVQVGHAREILKGIGTGFQEAMQDVGGLEPDEAERKANKLGRNLIDWCHEYGWTVTETRNGVERKQHEILDELEIGGGHREKQRQAEKDAASAQEGVALNSDPEEAPCLICGDRATTRIAIDVCDADRGMLNNQRKTKEPLMQTTSDEKPPETAIEDILAHADPEDLEDIEAALSASGDD